MANRGVVERLGAGWLRLEEKGQLGSSVVSSGQMGLRAFFPTMASRWTHWSECTEISKWVVWEKDGIRLPRVERELLNPVCVA